MTLTEQNAATRNALALDGRTDLVAALRELSGKIDGNTDKQNEALMRLGYSTASLNSAATDILAAAKLLGAERKQLAEIIARPAPLPRQRIYIAGSVLVGLIIGLIAPTIVEWFGN
jgi:hypothetical protein